MTVVCTHACWTLAEVGPDSFSRDVPAPCDPRIAYGTENY